MLALKIIKDLLKSGKGTIPLIVLFAVGILFVFFSDRQEVETVVKETVNPEFNFYEYERDLESKISEHLNNLNGVSQCETIVVLDCSYTYEYVRINSDDILVCENDDYDVPIIESIIAPEIKGVSVICIGGNDPTIKKDITDMLTSLLNISANKIWVGGKQ